MVGTLVFGCPVGPPPDSTFDDHTVPRLDTIEAFERFAITENGRANAKFIVTGFNSASESVRFVDSRFFQLHDEWYWFRLLNGQPVPGESVAPVSGHEFASIAEIYTWAKSQALLPLDLRWVDDGRLYSPRFYDLALFVPPRHLGLGTLIHVAARGTQPERWGFMLEYVDRPSHDELTHFFDQLEKALPAGIGSQVMWIVRSPGQETVAQDIIGRQLRFHDRILRLKELTVPGEVELYNEGITAGRLKIIKSGESIEGTTSADILVLEDVPDYLPPAAGVLTAVPQTPLAHFNLLAKNRGIPNAYLGGVIDDQELHDLAWLQRPVVFKATGPNQVIIKQISQAQYDQWRRSLQKTPVAVTQVELSTLPYVQDLRTLSVAQADVLRPSIGGKATGYLGLLAGAPEAAPDAVAAISIRPYAEHVAPMRARLQAMLANRDFLLDVRVRVLVLEGPAEFDQRYPTSRQWREMFEAAHGGDVLGDLVGAGGVKELIRSTPIDPTTLATITQALRAQFGHYAVTQGLRFRSSSTAEDVEGFNGAGLYDSNTGYLEPSMQPDPAEQKRSVEWALKKTWASYWSSEAYEERAQEAVDHLSGNMAVVVHAKFDDDKEKSNGVFLFTLHNGAATMELNVQSGAVSVTNPTTTALPEIDRVTLARGATAPTIERLRPSTLVAPGTVLLSDAELLETFERGRRVSTSWLDRENTPRPEPQRASTQVLDFEFRQVPAGWPALRTGTLPARVVLKQSRSLEPALRSLDPQVTALPVPHDLLMRSRRVERRTCQTPHFSVTVAEVYADPIARPTLGHTVDPLTAQVSITLKTSLGALPSGQTLTFDHRTFTGTHPELPAQWSLEGTFSTGQPLTALSLHQDRFRLASAEGSLEGTSLDCTGELLFSSPTELLLSFL